MFKGISFVWGGVPSLGIKLATFQFMGGCPTETHWPRHLKVFLKYPGILGVGDTHSDKK